MRNSVVPIGSRVHVTSYGPFRGLRGMIRAVDVIADDLEEPFCFYLIALEGLTFLEPIWFTYDEVELIGFPAVALESQTEFTSVGLLN
jgi:hypothetical protein